MTRRQLLTVVPAATLPMAAASNRHPLIVPVYHILDSEVKWNAGQIKRFEFLWSQAVSDLSRCGVQLEIMRGEGSIWRPYYREPVILGIRRGVLNFVVTDLIPTRWSGGRALAGVTTRYRGHHLCMVALNHAHGHQLPFFFINTCLHELLHALLLDIFDTPPPGLSRQARELRIDFQATRLWLFRDGGAIRAAAHTYVERLRAEMNS